ncbi:MAG: TPM domain-containing protein [Candidatus Omnitrophica bacterium]|nr:TPM domain-containing protein [Candidatus Omnitrophota bacterium]
MIRRFSIFLIFLSAVIATPSLLVAQEPALPDYSGYVNDFAGALSPQAEGAITSIAGQVEQKTGAQIAVVTVATTEPLTIEQYTVELFEKWGIGQKDKDNGILILMAVTDKKVRIETGYGLEGAIPDAIASQIVYQIMIPEFKKGNHEKGLILGAIAVADLVAKEYNVELELGEGVPSGYVQQAKVLSPGARLLKSLAYLIFFILIFGLRSGLLFYFILGPTGRRRGGHWYGTGFGGSSGGFGGGFGGFGGGFSGGGGASGGW